MRGTAHDVIQPIEDYRDYLLLLVRLPKLETLPSAPKVDASDVVQQAILHAHESRAPVPGARPEGEWLAWCSVRFWPTP